MIHVKLNIETNKEQLRIDINSTPNKSKEVKFSPDIGSR